MKITENYLFSLGVFAFALLPVKAFVIDFAVDKSDGIPLYFDESQEEERVYEGEATYYHNKFQGRRTASGERYNKRKYTAAVRMNKIDVPFGTMLEVKNVENGKTVRVKVNDRMPNRSTAIIDLSRAAASDIGMIEAGRTRVEIRVIK